MNAPLEQRLENSEAWMRQEIEKLRRQIAGTENDLQRMALQAHTAPVVEEDVGAPKNAALWRCGTCGGVLGWYVQHRSELRVRVKAVYIYVVPGAGGSTAITCERCGEMNRLRSDGSLPPEGVLAGDARDG